MNELFDTIEAAQQLRVSRQTLAKWRLQGFGPRFIRCGRKILYRAEDIALWLNSRTATSTTEADFDARRHQERQRIIAEATDAKAAEATAARRRHQKRQRTTAEQDV